MMVSFVVALCLSILGFFVIALVPFGSATNEKTRSQTAADAAALAAAEQIRTEWVDFHTRPLILRFMTNPGLAITSGTGQRDASIFAHRNDASLQRLRLSPGVGQVWVAVENTYTAHEDSGRARSEATAEMDISFTSCQWFPPVPPERPIESNPPGPPTFDARLTCGEWSADYVITNSVTAGYPVKAYDGTSRDELYQDLLPRLVE